MSYPVSLAVEDRIARVRLDRPDKHNALNLEMFRGLVAVQRKIRRDRRIRAVVLSGEGVDFCTGLDIKSMLGSMGSLLKIGWKLWPGQPNVAQRVSTGWSELPVPVIAAIHGRCWGGGFQVALGADFRIVHPAASLSIMEGKWGLIPDMGGTLALRALMPRDQALKLVMTAEQIDAATALELELITEVDDDPAGRAMALARTFCERSPDAIAAAKKLFHNSWTGPAWLALARETWYQLKVLAGRNQRIAVRRTRGAAEEFTAAGRW